MRKNIFNFGKIFAINVVFFGFLISLFEIVLSKYFSNAPAYNIPEARVDYKKQYDTSKIESLNQNSRSTYSRDKNGYRPFNNPDKNNLILTIGGSTTDDRFVDDEKTWQRVLEKNLFSVSVMNGGVDGQSTYGHIIAINKWHSKVNPPDNFDNIIFLIGINDVRFAKGVDSAIRNIYDSPSFLRKLRSFFAGRSFFYSKIKDIKIKFDYILGQNFSTPDGVEKMGYGIKNPNFLSVPIKAESSFKGQKELEPYAKLFNNLLLTAQNTFKNAKIHVVQQQDPKCLIKSVTKNSIYLRVSKSEIPAIEEYCINLASIYKTQEKVFKDNNYQNIYLVKMYADRPLKDEDFYDGIHTNSKGSEALGNYLAKNLKL